MPHRARLTPILALLVALALGLAACGEDDAELLPGQTAREITANLDAVRQLADEEDCVGAESAVEQVRAQIEALEEVDPRLKRALANGAQRLEEVVAGCEEEVEEAIEPAVEPEKVGEAEEAGEEEAGGGKGGKGGGRGPGAEAEERPRGQQSGPGPNKPTQRPNENKGKGQGQGETPPESPEPEPTPPAEGPPGGVSPSAPAGGAE